MLNQLIDGKVLISFETNLVKRQRLLKTFQEKSMLETRGKQQNSKRNPTNLKSIKYSKHKSKLYPQSILKFQMNLIKKTWMI